MPDMLGFVYLIKNFIKRHFTLIITIMNEKIP